ncbi:hypothetical protein TWF694_000976 [Orbilia ellipsospora]|uniref:Uncharacterized protein n=1 Tax=Orbilia ellipsospora TaxID=2528407 RepID=A0AAV9XSU5_9PEZI
MKFTLAIALVASIIGAQAAPNPVVTSPPIVTDPIPCSLRCGTATKTVPPLVCTNVLCPRPPVCPQIIVVTQEPCCCKTAHKVTTVTAPCCNTKCVIPTDTIYTSCPVATAVATATTN